MKTNGALTSVKASSRLSPLGLLRTQRTGLIKALDTASYEILPFKTTEETVLRYVPRSVALTVTTTEAKGLEPTLALTGRLATHGYKVAPHIAARLVRDESHLLEIAARMTEEKVDQVFIVGGDAREPVGKFSDALSLLNALNEMNHPFQRVGIGGYPEGHEYISEVQLEQALKLKAPLASHIITQLCFDSKTTTSWAQRISGQGIDLPIRVGIPGAVSRQKLVRISASLGLGQSARFLKKQQSMFWRFFLPGGYSPNPLVSNLAEQFANPENNIEGFHIFTFNELESTEAWRQEWLKKLS